MSTGIQEWYFRKDGSSFNPHVIYADHPCVFSMKVFHGGTFTPSPNRKYFGGKVQYVDLLDIEWFTIDIIHNIVKMLKYDPRDIMFYHFNIPNKTLDWGLRALASDDDVVNLSQYVKDNKVIDVYIEHGETTVESYYMPKFIESAKIMELDENNEVIDLDEENVDRTVVTKKQTNGKFLGLPKCRKRLAIEWLAGGLPGESSGLREDNVDFNDGAEGLREDNVDFNDSAEGLGDEHGNENGNDEGDVDDAEELVDEEHIIDQLDVNMEGFRFTVQSEDEGDIDPLRPVVNLNEDDLEVIDYDSFESDVGDDDVNSDRRKALRELKRKGKANGDGNIVNFFYVGQEFPNREEVKNRIRAHALETRRQITIVKNDNVRVRAKCLGIIPTLGDADMCSFGLSKSNGITIYEGGKKQITKDKETKVASVKGKGKKVNTDEDEDKNECPWTVYMAKGENDKWLVRTYKKEHICLQSRQIKAATASFLSKHVLDLINLNPEIPIKAVQDQMQKQFQVGVSKHKAFRAKSKAAEVMKGDAEVQYKILRDYVVELKKCNPNTTVKLDVYGEEDPESTTRIFRRIYVCLGALKEGFKAGGRELLGLDGAFMKGQYPGQLITAVSVDANNGIYPVAYGIVESESKDSWIWFLNCLGDDLELYRNSNFTFITDRQKGLLLAIKTLFSAAEHRYCVRHIYQNMSLTRRRGIYKELLWKAATATTIVEFNKVMDTLKAQNLKAYEWLKKIPAEHWSRSYFTCRAHCDLLINNICEVFNRQLLDARDSPVVSALEYNGDDLIQVKGPYGDQCVVNLQQRVCSCRKWEVSGLPCKHAVAAIHNMAENGMNVGLPKVWVHPSYRLDTWKQQYSFKVNPLSGRNFWELKQWPTTLLPPYQPKITTTI
ncbi:hypothetical protein Tco_0349224 [Tanacetum coccineum]